MTESINQRYTRLSILAALGFALFRTAVMGQSGLGDSESYYWAWSQRFGWSYYDHPPMVAWLIRLFTDIGGDITFWVRMPSVLLFLLFAWLFYLIAMELFDDARVAFFTIVTFNLAPVFGIAALQMVPDVPSAVCFLAYILILHKMLVNDGPGWVWYPLGALIGLGLLGKYFAIMLVPSTIILVAAVPEYRRWFFKPQPYTMALTALILFLPVVIWNIDTDWPSFKFHLVDRHDNAGFSTRNLERLIGGQLLYMSPLYLICFLWAVVKGTRRAFEGDRRYATLAAFSGPVLLFFYVVCFWTNESEPHWPAFGYLTAIIMMSALGLEIWDHGKIKHAKWTRNFFAASTALAAAIFIAFYTHIFFPFLPMKPKHDITNELFGWEKVAEVVEKTYKEKIGDGKPGFVLAHHWTLCSQIMFATKDRLPVSCINERIDQFDFWDNEKELMGRNAIVISDLRFDEPPGELYRFKEVFKIEDIPIIRGGKRVRKFTVWLGIEYGGLTSQPIQ